jgi:ATP-dependent DNA ligase
MLASKCPEGFTIRPGEWIADIKIDGHRIIAEILEGAETLLDDEPKTVRAWSRDGLPRLLPSHVRAGLLRLPVGVYDGELAAPGERSFGTTKLTSQGALVYYVFDVLHLTLGGASHNVMSQSYATRRSYLTVIFDRCGSDAVQLVESAPVQTMDDVKRLFNQVKARDGEGLILKRVTTPYQPGKRSKDWIKIKKCESAVLTVTDYLPGKEGPCARVELVDESGIRTSVKTKNRKERERLASRDMRGEKLVIDYTEFTPGDGNYREPRWNRWFEVQS